MNEQDLTKFSDRDLLVSLHTKVGIITTSLSDHETRIRAGEAKDSELQGSIRGISWIGGFLSLAIGVISFFGWHSK